MKFNKIFAAILASTMMLPLASCDDSDKMNITEFEAAKKFSATIKPVSLGFREDNYNRLSLTYELKRSGMSDVCYDFMNTFISTNRDELVDDEKLIRLSENDNNAYYAAGYNSNWHFDTEKNAYVFSTYRYHPIDEDNYYLDLYFMPNTRYYARSVIYGYKYNNDGRPRSIVTYVTDIIEFKPYDIGINLSLKFRRVNGTIVDLITKVEAEGHVYRQLGIERIYVKLAVSDNKEDLNFEFNSPQNTTYYSSADLNVYDIDFNSDMEIGFGPGYQNPKTGSYVDMVKGKKYYARVLSGEIRSNSGFDIYPGVYQSEIIEFTY